MKRLFAAIKVDPDATFLKTYSELRQMLRAGQITWVDDRKIHITLKFFGDTPEDSIPGMIDLFAEIASRHPSFEVDLSGTGIFGSSYNPRVIWFGMSHLEAIGMLAEDVLNTFHNHGFPRDEQHFRPHLTIGRIKHFESKKYFQQVIDRFKTTYLQNIQVSRFELIESKLTPRGPIYTTLETFGLKEKKA
ncbi:MAG: RNA 2',3'-cyclic phosphodiesterase [Bacteroidales bacterium]|nr:RNA 2',3'-cyclic phosphodiesterase [Bacteroidales bacterium]